MLFSKHFHATKGSSCERVCAPRHASARSLFIVMLRVQIFSSSSVESNLVVLMAALTFVEFTARRANSERRFVCRDAKC
jgi:hypothetical protein